MEHSEYVALAATNPATNQELGERFLSEAENGASDLIAEDEEWLEEFGFEELDSTSGIERHDDGTSSIVVTRNGRPAFRMTITPMD